MAHKDKGEAVYLETRREGRPYEGKVLAAVQAHADDIPFFCAGTVAKLIDEGYTGYLIQTTNDEKCGPTRSIGRTVLQNERDVDELAEILGLKEVFNLGYRNHRLDEISPVELRARLAFLFRALKVDTVLTFNPWGHDEENPDHYVTGHAVEAAAWMSGMNKDYPEHLAFGIELHTVDERYYWVARPGQPYNRVVDISDQIEIKIDSHVSNSAQGPGGDHGARLRRDLAARGLCLAELGDDDAKANREYARLFLLDEEREIGERLGVAYAERFHYMARQRTSPVEQYVREHAVPLA